MRSSPHLSKAQKAHLAEVLEGLPSVIAFLRMPILALARQDQELLGAGEGDTDLLADAIRENSASIPPGDAADVLREWLEQRDDSEERWAGPAWFAEGFLRGGELFGIEEDHQKPPPPPLGLQLVDVDVPKGMRTKVWASALQLKNREVEIFVIELDDKSYQIRWQTPLPDPPPELPPEFRVPHLRDEREFPFKVGNAIGERRISRHVESGLVVICGVGLEFPGAKVEVRA